MPSRLACSVPANQSANRAKRGAQNAATRGEPVSSVKRCSASATSSAATSAGRSVGKRWAKRPSASCTICPRSAASGEVPSAGSASSPQDALGEDGIGVGDPLLDRRDAELARPQGQRRLRLRCPHRSDGPVDRVARMRPREPGPIGLDRCPMPPNNACSLSSQRDGTVGTPSILAARVR